MVNNLYSDVLCCYMQMLVFFILFFQLDLELAGNVLGIFIIVLFILSHSQFAMGWYGVVWNGLTAVISDKRLKSLLSNSFPWTCKIRFGNPKLRKCLLNSKSEAALLDLFLVGNAGTNLLQLSTITKRHSKRDPLD